MRIFNSLCIRFWNFGCPFQHSLSDSVYSSQVFVSVVWGFEDFLANVTGCLRLRGVDVFEVFIYITLFLRFVSTIQANVLISTFGYTFRIFICQNRKEKVLKVGWLWVLAITIFKSLSFMFWLWNIGRPFQHSLSDSMFTGQVFVSVEEVFEDTLTHVTGCLQLRDMNVFEV